MKELPKSETYEKEFEFMPWRTLIYHVREKVRIDAVRNGCVLDLMCGPGYLLGEIYKLRKDLILEGVDINNKYIEHAKYKYPDISFKGADVLSFSTKKKYNVILCTGGIHHLPYNKQVLFLETIPLLLKPKGFAVFADPYVDNYSNDIERKQSAAKLGYEYMIATIKNDAPNDVVKAAIDILYNDVMGFEYKTSLKRIEPVFRKLFSQVEINKTWPEFKSDFGDYYVVCKK